MQRDLDSIASGMSQYQHDWGEWVSWFEFDSKDSAADPIYDEGPSRIWFPPIVMPVTSIAVRQSVPSNAGDGLYTVSSATLTFQVTEAADRFKVDPLMTELHFRDRFAYQSVIYMVNSYVKVGNVHGTWLVITVQGEEVKDDELSLDVQQRDFYTQEMTW